MWWLTQDKKNLILVMGKSCSGKDTVINDIKSKIENGKFVSPDNNKYVHICKMHSTRPPRPNKPDEYIFETKEDLDNYIKSNRIIESRSYKVANGETWYYYTTTDTFIFDRYCCVNIYTATPESFYPICKYCEDNNIELHTIYIDADYDTRMERYKLRDGYEEKEAIRRLQQDDIDFMNITNDIPFNIRYNSINNSGCREYICNSLCDYINDIIFFQI